MFTVTVNLSYIIRNSREIRRQNSSEFLSLRVTAACLALTLMAMIDLPITKASNISDQPPLLPVAGYDSLASALER
jgi:hypothetical protein